MTTPAPLPFAEFFDLLPIAEGSTWTLKRNDELAGLGSADVLSTELASPVWAADIVLDATDWADARRLGALIRSMNGPSRSAMMLPLLSRAPAADPDGALLGESIVTIAEVNADNARLRLAGLPFGYELTIGDYGSVAYGSNPERFFLFEMSSGASAGMGGETGWITVTPHIWPGIAAGQAVTLIAPRAKMFVVPESLREGAIRRGTVDGVSFSMRQRP